MEQGTAELIAAARAVRENAYAPYSGYRVGAAVRDERGRIHAGCNVENISYGLCLCAERNAIGRLIAEGGREVREVAVVTKDGGTPCGMCRQALVEFAPKDVGVAVHCVDEGGRTHVYSLRELLPAAFESEAVERTPSQPEGST